MIPNVFISSTVDDLRYLRDAIREVIQQIGYIPRMSEYGDLGYSPFSSAENSCYTAMKECHIAILIIGKRYGELKSTDISVTHSEFRAAREGQIPIINLVDKEVLTNKKIYDANKTKKNLTIPGMDHPVKTFSFLEEIMNAPVNNAYLDFSDVATARNHIRNQLAHMFGDFLIKSIDPLKSDIKDVLSEIKALRHELKPNINKDNIRFMKAIRLLVDDDYDQYRIVVQHLYDTLENGIADLITSNSFAEFIKRATGHQIEIVNMSVYEEIRRYLESRHDFVFSSYGGQKESGFPTATLFGITRDKKKVFINENNLRQFEALHKSFRAALDDNIKEGLTNKSRRR
jgi:hypothetical protein